MGSFTKKVVLLYLTSTVLCTPFINQLQPGKEWSACHSVQQPKPEDYEGLKNGVTKETEDTTEIEKVAPKDAPESKKNTSEEPEKVDYTGWQVMKVSTIKSNVKRVMDELASEKLITSWGRNPSTIDVLIKPKVIDNVANVLKSKNISYSIMIEDLQQRINEENPPLDANEIKQQNKRGKTWLLYSVLLANFSTLAALLEPFSTIAPAVGTSHSMTWKQYHSVEEIHGFMDYLAHKYPSIIRVKTIGQSYEGRNLKVLRISNGNPTNRAVFIDGGIHAREWISPAVVTFFINQFAENFDSESDDIKDINWYFLPVVNPDGYEYSRGVDRLWRKNRKGLGLPPCVGADLNRNFGYQWGGKGASRFPCSETYRGSAAFSEPESKAISDFFNSTAVKFSAYLTYHSYGQYILYPWGYDNTVPPDYRDLQFVGEQIAEAIKNTGGSTYEVGSSSGIFSPASGGSDDYAKSTGVKYTYTIELSDTGQYGFVLPASYIVPVAQENLAGLRVLAHMVNKG